MSPKQAIAAVALHAVAVGCSAPTVTVINGTISGIQIPGYNQEAFLGIPFAQAPIGDLRLAPPKPLETTWDVLNATQYYPRCAGYGGEQNGQEQSEDCLALNVVRPVGYENVSLPVGLWIYGGGWSQGGTIDTLYNLSYIVQNAVDIGKPIIGVSIAYRLNGFGWMDSKELRAAGATNLGLRDQRLALHWVNENIAVFGGKPNQVTIWGESAGAFSVAQHLIAYGGRDDKLFSGAILQSGHPLGTTVNANKSAEQAKYDRIVKDSGCNTAANTLKCLRGLTYEELNNALNITAQYNFSPYVDGDLIQGSVYSQLEKGEFVKVPILVGANSDDSLAANVINTDQEFRKFLEARGSSDNQTISAFEALYPNIPGYLIPETITAPVDPALGAQYKRVKTFDADFTFIAGRRIMTQAWSRFNQTAYSYRFNVLAAPELIPSTYGATHWVEVAYVFDNPMRLNLGFPEETPEGNQRLAKLMSKMWASFIHSGTPNGHEEEGYPEWPVYRDGWGGYGNNYVFDANATSYVEYDSFRGPAIAYISRAFKTVYGK